MISHLTINVRVQKSWPTVSRLGCFCLLYYVVAMGLSKTTQLLWACPSSQICYKAVPHKQNVLALECFTFPVAFSPSRLFYTPRWLQSGLDGYVHAAHKKVSFVPCTREFRMLLDRLPGQASCDCHVQYGIQQKAKILKILKQIQNKSM